MGKWINDLAMDAELDYLADSDKLFVCSAQPATYAEASIDFNLATETLTGGDFAKANGDVSGRKLTVAAQNGLAVDATGDATHIAIGKSAGSILKMVTTVTTQTLTVGNTVNVPAWDHEIADPA